MSDTCASKSRGRSSSHLVADEAEECEQHESKKESMQGGDEKKKKRMERGGGGEGLSRETRALHYLPVTLSAAAIYLERERGSDEERK